MSDPWRIQVRIFWSRSDLFTLTLWNLICLHVLEWIPFLPTIISIIFYPHQGTKEYKEQRNNSGILTRWWFQIFFIFTLTWGDDPIWLIFFSTISHQTVLRLSTRELHSAKDVRSATWRWNDQGTCCCWYGYIILLAYEMLQSPKGWIYKVRKKRESNLHLRQTDKCFVNVFWLFFKRVLFLMTSFLSKTHQTPTFAKSIIGDIGDVGYLPCFEWLLL